MFVAALTVWLMMNIIAFALMGRDGRCARQGKWASPERRSLLATARFGGPGGVLGMKVFHHKRQHWYFKGLFPMRPVLQKAVPATGTYLLMQ